MGICSTSMGLRLAAFRAGIAEEDADGEQKTSKS
jgi:hypothetical protein